MTLVLRRAPAVDLAITGGQDTVAVRVPGHPVAQQLLRAFGSGIAAPSANRYGRVSPTRVEHVREEFGDALGIVLDGGDCKIGLESTIVDCVDAVPRVLRPGFITLSQLRSVVPEIQGRAEADSPRVPGSDVKHYAPSTPLSIVDGRRLEEVVSQLTDEHEKVAVLALRPPRAANKFMTWINAGRRAEVYARELYVNLRALDKSGAQGDTGGGGAGRRGLGRGTRSPPSRGIRRERRRNGSRHRCAQGRSRRGRRPLMSGRLVAARNARMRVNADGAAPARPPPRHAAARHRLRIHP